LADVFISYARQDARWATVLASRLRGYGLQVFLYEWCVLPGDVVAHELERAIRESACGIAVISPASLAAPQALEEYAALVHASADQRLRFIPVLAGDVALPPFAANRVWRDFRNVDGQAYDDKVAELAAVISGRVLVDERQVTVREDNIPVAQPAPPRPITKPAQHAFVVCYAADDVHYGGQLIGRLREAGLPAWSVGDLQPGDAHFWRIRQQLAYAIAVIVMMSPQSQDSDDITRMILEGQLRDRPFVPFLLAGDVNYHLASTWYFDARYGRLPDSDLLVMLRRLYEADAAGGQADPAKVLPPPLARPMGPAVRVPQSAGLDQLDRYLGEREFEYADLLTTTLVLESANRLGEGWMRERDGRELPPALIFGIDALWSRHSGGRHGFRVQLSLAQVRHGRHAEFLALAAACGWRDIADVGVGRHYREFSKRAAEGGRPGFFPTLRNPQSERYVHWYDLWEPTVLAVHLRLQEWQETK
jgi:TIR domain/GUN4-like